MSIISDWKIDIYILKIPFVHGVIGKVELKYIKHNLFHLRINNIQRHERKQDFPNNLKD